jgi:hypothetical protein
LESRRVEIVREILARIDKEGWAGVDPSAYTPDYELILAEELTGRGKGWEGFRRVRDDWDEVLVIEGARLEQIEEVGERVLTRVRMRNRGASSGAVVEQLYWQVYEFQGELVSRTENFNDEAAARAAASA